MFKKNILVVFLILTLVFSCAGCIQKQTEKAGTLTPAETVTTAMDALKKSDTKTFNTCIQHTAGSNHMMVENKLLDTSLDKEGKAFVDAVVSNLSYTIKEESVDGQNATVTVVFSNSDLSEVINDLVRHAMNEKTESQDAQLDELILQAGSRGAVTTEIDLSLVMKDGMWKIILDDDAMNAICGNLFSGGNGFD